MIEEKHASLDIGKLTSSVVEELRSLHTYSDRCSIYRVPKRLRKLKEGAYTPQAVSIGPLHQGKEELAEMEGHKIIYLQEFLKMTGVSTEDLIAAIAEKETRLRDCYAETFGKLASEEFVKMMMMDGSFILMVLWKYVYNIQNSNIERVVNDRWVDTEIRYDLCLLKNQLPFFILEDLFEFSSFNVPCSMIELIHAFLVDVCTAWVPDRRDVNLEEIINLNSSRVPEHFIDFVRLCQQPINQKQPSYYENMAIPSAVELQQAGVKFKSRSSKNIFDINFDGNTGTLEIPILKIYRSSEMVFRNLHAFVQCHCRVEYVSDYITMINLLVYATRDVEMLVRHGVVENWLRDNDEALRLLHDLDRNNIVNRASFYYSDVVEGLRDYMKKPTNKWKAALALNYFNNPWVSISVIAAVFLFILTITQTVFSILQVVRMQHLVSCELTELYCLISCNKLCLCRALWLKLLESLILAFNES
ncbi:hypothetical protein SADUNF_Sadunf01G0014400 [Salix dunnii]|uniref:Uncharacterized protein n=1 Tax=Salix dunnii TaxID=1413687 RepID=A0A835N9P6_9ROSI|nr:hypothetical protein SADUNF_Sadunf01G0014400 [Salix dunnii]